MMRRCTGVSVTSLIRRRMAPRSTRHTGSQRRLGGNARSFLSRYIVVSLVGGIAMGEHRDNAIWSPYKCVTHSDRLTFM